MNCIRASVVAQPHSEVHVIDSLGRCGGGGQRGHRAERVAGDVEPIVPRWSITATPARRSHVDRQSAVGIDDSPEPGNSTMTNW